MICSQCLCSLEAPAGCQWVCVLALGEGPKAGHSRTQGRGRGWSRRSKVTPTAYNHPHRAGLLPGPLSLSLSISLSLSLSLPFNLTVPLFLVLSKYPPFYFHLHRCFFHVSAFILSISFICITPSLSILSCISSFSLSVYLFLWRYRWTHLQVNLNSWRCIISILLLPHICSEFSPLP